MCADPSPTVLRPMALNESLTLAILRLMVKSGSEFLVSGFMLSENNSENLKLETCNLKRFMVITLRLINQHEVCHEKHTISWRDMADLEAFCHVTDGGLW